MYRKAFVVTYTCIALVVANYIVEEQKPIGAFDGPPACSSTLTLPLPSPTPDTTLNIKLANTYTDGNAVNAYVIGRDKDQNLAFLNKDGKTWWYPGNPGPCDDPKDCHCIVSPEPVLIPVPPGDVGMPLSIDRYLVSTRVYFAHGTKGLQFRLNWNATGPLLAEPSYVDPLDTNWAVDWGFAEFAWDGDNMNADVSFLDFVGSPVGLTLETPEGTQYAKGTPPDAIECTCKKLKCQEDNAKDGVVWSSLCVKDGDGNVIRVLGANHATDSSFDDYFKSYVGSVWDYYKKNTLTINSYADWTAQVDENEMLVFATDPSTNNTPGSFAIPDTNNIFGCANGAFEVNGPDARVRTIPILCAAINRATLLLPSGNQQPNGITDVKDYYYQSKTCNHFSRIVHEVEIDKLGYGFPYDEVKPSDALDQQGKVEVSTEDVGSSLLTITVGGISDSPGCSPENICPSPSLRV